VAEALYFSKNDAMATACVALGSNMGDRPRHLRDAVDAIAALPGVADLRQGGVYETEPVGGPPGQDFYLNSAVRFTTTLPPETLLAKLLEIERAAGRPHRDERQPNGPRPLDLDLLLYDDRVIDRPGLTLPHPRMHGREFVLAPLADVAPQMTHPVLGRTIRELLFALK